MPGYVVPRREGVGAWRQLGAGRDHPELLLAGEGLLAEAVPSLVELPFVLVCPLLGHVVGGMATAGGEVDEERLVGVLGPHGMKPLDGLIRHRVGEVVGLFRVVELGGRADDLLVLGQARVPLARSAPEDPVEVVEAPAVRPAVERAGGPLLAIGGQVPLPEGGGGCTRCR